MTVKHQTITLTLDCEEMDTIYTALDMAHDSLIAKGELTEGLSRLKGDIFDMMVALGSISPMDYSGKYSN